MLGEGECVSLLAVLCSSGKAEGPLVIDVYENVF